ncbi:hypothetical protein CYMTET_21852 [Cymbomonas tetramitiformis]|uniref:Uncharacterized protein n=1 Tax=Cymbomonas tetramitiformis TaxID=36881 RepID=A0AAE0G1S4_9CHLO|nr:hypothetical protein CYMTET_21852 [Cymbomonas tetramitiformis]
MKQCHFNNQHVPLGFNEGFEYAGLDQKNIEKVVKFPNIKVQEVFITKDVVGVVNSFVCAPPATGSMREAAGFIFFCALLFNRNAPIRVISKYAADGWSKMCVEGTA